MSLDEISFSDLQCAAKKLSLYYFAPPGKLWEDLKAAELINVIFENSSPHRCFRLKKVKNEHLILWSYS